MYIEIKSDIKFNLRTNSFHLFGLSETRLTSYIPHYSLIRKDAARSQHTDLAVYINPLICKIVLT